MSSNCNIYLFYDTHSLTSDQNPWGPHIDYVSTEKDLNNWKRPQQLKPAKKNLSK